MWDSGDVTTLSAWSALVGRVHGWAGASATDLELDAGAKRLFRAWQKEVEARRRPGGNLHSVNQWAQKMTASVGRLAGLLHVAQGGTTYDGIEAATVARAIVIGEYWCHHALTLSAVADDDPMDSDALAVLDGLSKIGTQTVAVPRPAPGRLCPPISGVPVTCGCRSSTSPSGAGCDRRAAPSWTTSGRGAGRRGRGSPRVRRSADERP